MLLGLARARACVDERARIHPHLAVPHEDEAVFTQHFSASTIAMECRREGLHLLGSLEKTELSDGWRSRWRLGGIPGRRGTRTPRTLMRGKGNLDEGRSNLDEGRSNKYKPAAAKQAQDEVAATAARQTAEDAAKMEIKNTLRVVRAAEQAGRPDAFPEYYIALGEFVGKHQRPRSLQTGLAEPKRSTKFSKTLMIMETIGGGKVTRYRFATTTRLTSK